jgi:hypothetical protein
MFRFTNDTRSWLTDRYLNGRYTNLWVEVREWKHSPDSCMICRLADARYASVPNTNEEIVSQDGEHFRINCRL